MDSKPGGGNGKSRVLLGKYEVGRLLGRGTFAKVYHGRSVSDGSCVAVKVLDKPEVVGTGAGPRVLREVSAMRGLSHPNVLRLLEVMATRSKIYLVMELAPGGDLLSLLTRSRGGRLPEPAARRYLLQIVAALRYCHARGVAHRDVKPQNLLLARDGALKLSDFGLAALAEQRGRDGRLHTACGTPAYAAPEVALRRAGAGYDGARADAWSCGVILFVLLAGRLPFDDANIPLMYRRIHRRDYAFPPWVSPAARRVVARLLDPNPETRLTIEALAEHPWFKRSLSLDSQLSLMGAPAAPPPMNAFEIISLSAGLDLSGLFDEGSGRTRRRRRGRRFTSTEPAARVVARVEEAGRKLGFAVGRRKEGARGIGGLGWALSVEVAEVAPPLILVQLTPEYGGGGGGGSEEFAWAELRSELGDVAVAWHGGEDDE
ncbi:LOW QUALITY PROTEIN: CBL-interacting protein kinase 7-like [Ananas comosus]|uniref:non-specific serine/threonine protein kinase n=1 Tax=Ananas comosus TaxID=4615 RepID=A0A6P5F6U8_ANACO|nr:LOW QUALITY PROTEIN: CBL-interacting protein kinase 7-like [Ananas comosus]